MNQVEAFGEAGYVWEQIEKCIAHQWQKVWDRNEIKDSGKKKEGEWRAKNAFARKKR